MLNEFIIIFSVNILRLDQINKKLWYYFIIMATIIMIMLSLLPNLYVMLSSQMHKICFLIHPQDVTITQSTEILLCITFFF